MATAWMPSCLGAHKLGAHRIDVERALDIAVGAHALVDLGDALIKHVRLDDMFGKNFRPRLIADTQRVTEAFGDEQKRALALALKQRVGRDRGAHFDRADARLRNRLAWRQPKQPAHAGHCRVGIGFRIFRQ